MAQTDLPLEVPTIRWDQLETVLTDLANTHAKRIMVRHLVEGTRKQAAYLPPEVTYREILFISFALLDGDFEPPDLNSTTLSRA